MRRPHLSTGAWICTGLVSAAILTPTAVYAANAASTVAIGNTGNSTTATVTTGHQLLTTTIAPKNVVLASGFSNGTCDVVYVPPAGQAIVVAQVTYDIGTGTAGNEAIAVLGDATCVGQTYDYADTTLAYEAQTRTFPIGLPAPSVGVRALIGVATVTLTGYLIPASQLPAAAPSVDLPARTAP